MTKFTWFIVFIVLLALAIGIVSILAGDATLANIAADIANVQPCGSTICTP